MATHLRKNAGSCPVTGAETAACPLPKGPKGLPLIGVAPRYLKNQLGFTLDTQQTYGPLVPVPMPVPFVQVTEPSAIEHVLRTNPDNYRRGVLYKGFFGPMGTGLLTLDDQQWRPHRKVVQPGFAPARVHEHAAEAVPANQDMLRRWERLAHDGRPVDVAPDLMNITARVVGEALVSRDLSEPGLGYSEAAAIASKVMYTATIHGVNEMIPTRIPTRYNQEKNRSERVLRGIVERVLDRRRTGELGNDVATLLLRSDLSDESIIANLRTLLLAGTDTTGQALCWTLYELARHPQVRREVEEEVDRVLTGRPPRPDQLDDLVLTRSVVEEALRLYPPVWQIPRDSVDEDELAGYRLPPNTTVLLSMYGTHRSPEHWRDPEAFDPSRFRDGCDAGRHRFAYFPFGGGRRLCIGKSLAMATAITTIAMVAQRFRLRLVGGGQFRFGTYITLFPRDGLRVVLEERV
ncbi:cytochrome P450 [Nocardia sp. CDC159]|uniref:Cytochrome P450 n=1 Tax=Nocardia pulmonis TaxID=2951408 RepID=A0A9X2E8A7_9NOCA|nr:MULTISPECIES: cytochrome P450 [Nocardia]MCM6775461.1 cytochrome P450 [Nocardia pulmonis]MCM6787805.1 cytochrome P450 [Nocardia sp. CDC159]